MRFLRSARSYGLWLYVVLILVTWSLEWNPTPARAATGQLTATWTDSTPTDHDGFKIQRKTGTTGTYAQIATVGPTVMSYLDTGLTAGSTYCYQVEAYNAAGDSLPTSEVCAVVPTPVLSTLTVTKVGSGTIASSPSGIDCGATCSASFTGGTSVALTATPATGATFTGWSGACTGTGACTVILDGTKSVTATFTATPTTYTLTVSKSGTGSGTVSSTPTGLACGSACSASFTGGATVTLTAAPTTGATFTGWSGACAGTGPCTLTMTRAKNVTATFTVAPAIAPTTYALTVNKSGTGNGTVTSSPTGISGGSTCSASFNSGTAVTLSAAITSGSSFTGWSGACTGTGPCTLTMTQAKNVTATFTSTTSPDLLWRNTRTGEAYVWFMDGTTRAGGQSLGTMTTSWQIAGVGDFNGDGKPDLLWYNPTTGDVYVWFMDGTRLITSTPVYRGADLAYRIAGVGDFNGDGKPDLLWRNTSTGEVYVWFMNGTTEVGGQSLGTMATIWQIVSVGNFGS